MRKAINKLMIGLILVLSSLFVRTPIKAADFSVSSFVDLQSALSDGDASINITVTASFDITALLVIPTGKTVSITSEGGTFTLKRDGSLTGHLVTVQSGASLTLTNIILDGNKDTVVSDGSIINNEGSFTLASGAVLQNNNAGAMEGAGLHNAANATAVIDGGVIMNNTNPGRAGGGSWSAGTLTMNSGEIKNNHTDAGGGGVVVASGGIFVFNDGSINNNTSNASGGGINVFLGGTLNMHGGSVINNSTVNDLAFGGGIYITGDGTDNGAANVIDGGVINGNSATGGAGVDNNANLTITNATIDGNHATKYYGGGIENTKNLTLGADVTISNNDSKMEGGGVFNNYYGVLVIDGATISNNQGTNGGGVGNRNLTTFNSGTITGNTADNTATYPGDGDGGGIYVMAGTFTMNGGTISNNTCVDGGGGVAVAANATFLMHGGTISNNTAGAGGGGGINVTTNGVNDGIATIDGGLITENSAEAGGGLSINGTVTISNATISKNKATVYYGGGIENYKNLTLGEGTIISDNEAEQVAGGILNQIYGEITINGASIIGNTAKGAGGIYNLNELTITSGTISNNSATAGGGGAITHSINKDLHIDNATISNNTAVTGAGGINVSAANLEYVKIGADVTFSGNSTDAQPYKLDTATDGAVYDAAIEATAWTKPFDKGYNNVDISYTAAGFEAQIVTFDVEGNKTLVDPKLVDKGGTVTKPADPVKPGYKFDGWYYDSSYTNAWVFATAAVSPKQLATAAIMKKNLAAAGSGNIILRDPEPVVTAMTVDSNIILYGRFSKLPVVTFMSHGTALDEVYVESGEAVTKPSDPVLANHTFVGWYSDSSLTTPYDFDTLVTADLILYAKWEPHKVELISNGSKLSEFLVDDDSTLALPPNPIRSGYTFGGWYLDEACTIPFDAEMKIEEDMKLYAKWIPAGGSSASAGAGVGGEVYTGYDNQAGFWLTMSGLALLVLLAKKRRHMDNE